MDESDQLYVTFAWYGIDPTPSACMDYFAFGREWLGQFGRRLKSRVLRRHGKFHRRVPAPLLADFADIEGYTEVTYLKEKHGGLHYSEELSVHRNDATGLISFQATLTDIGSTVVDALTCSVERILQPRYGIGYRRALKYGPSAYACGIGYYPAEEIATQIVRNEERSVWHNMREERPQEHGQIRGVYAWNLLNETQLGARVGSLPLSEWIAQDKRRGVLTRSQGGSSLAVWTVPDRPARIEIERELCHAGVVCHTGPCDRRTSLNH